MTYSQFAKLPEGARENSPGQAKRSPGKTIGKIVKPRRGERILWKGFEAATMKKCSLFVIVLICMSTTTPSRAATPDWKQQFAKASDEYFDQVYFHYAPSNGTMVGYHQYDAQLEDFSRKNIDAQIAALRNFTQRIEAIV